MRESQNVGPDFHGTDQKNHGQENDCQDLADIDTAGNHNAADDRQQQEPQDIVDYGRTQNQAGLGRLLLVDVLQHAGCDAHTGRSQGGGNEQIGVQGESRYQQSDRQ